ncbi:MAG: Rieske 2Fe-2S domain-containing protein [Acidimicrobiales bacterium]|nr:Rieske 2Fe-2S domain-containing protein [Acidimicrobiales bacterium]
MSAPSEVRPPFPVGWFAVAWVDEVPEGAMVPLAVFGQDLAVGRMSSGRALVTHSVCPHLGADLAAGGYIDNDQVVCPLHNWCFNHLGACISATDDPIPETARLRVWPTEVANGTIWAYNGRDGEEPTLSPPDTSIAWSSGRRLSEGQDGHPEDVLAKMLTGVGVIDGSPVDNSPNTWVGRAADGLRVSVCGPGTLLLQGPGGESEVVHVTPVDGFGVDVRTSSTVPSSGIVEDQTSFRNWYRRFDRSLAPSRSRPRLGRAGRRAAQEDRPTKPSIP